MILFPGYKKSIKRIDKMGKGTIMQTSLALNYMDGKGADDL